MTLFECNQCKKKVPKTQVLNHLKSAHGFVPTTTERAHEFFFKSVSSKTVGNKFNSSRASGITNRERLDSLRKQYKSKVPKIKCDICNAELNRDKVLRHFRRAHPTVDLDFEVRNGQLVERLTRREILRFFERESEKQGADLQCPICKSGILRRRLKGHLRKHGYDVDKLQTQLDTDRREYGEDLFDRASVFRGGGANPR